MLIEEHSGKHRDIAGVVIACLFIFIAVIALWDTTNMIDPDSYVFPRAVAIAMIVFSVLLIIQNLIRPTDRVNQGEANGSTVRRVSLVLVMLLNSFLMPWIGFLISGVVTFLLLMMVAMYDEWTAKRKLIYPLVAVAIVTGFYTLFTQALLVPLPIGTLFD